jgi:type V secretory pathway adhesin AidA
VSTFSAAGISGLLRPPGFSAARLSIPRLGLAASLEGGAPFRLGGGWQLEPQTRLVYQTVDLEATNDVAAFVQFKDVGSLASRIVHGGGALSARTGDGLVAAQPVA